MVRGQLIICNQFLLLIGQIFPDDQVTEVQDVATSHTSREDHASDILRCHYDTLSQSFRYSFNVAQLLHGAGVISWTAFFSAKNKHSQSEEEATLVVLKEVRYAVHTNYQNLVLFANVLLKQTSNVPCGKAILKDCGKY